MSNKNTFEDINYRGTFAIWSPSSPAPFLFPIRFKRALANLKKNDISIIIGQSCKTDIEYTMDFQKKLAEEFHSFLLTPEVDGVIFATGGWTTISLLDYIDWNLVKKYPKIIVGYSDATPFLLACYKKTGITTFHGPMVVSEWGEFGGIWEYTKKNFFMALSKKKYKVNKPSTWTDETLWWDKEDNRKRKPVGDSEWRFLKRGKAKGKLLGGNLTTLLYIVGNEYMPDLRGSLFFIEEQDCSPDEFFSQLYSLKLLGVFNKINGLIVGRIGNKKKAANGYNDFDKMIELILSDIDIPVLVDVDIGHTEPMITIPIGKIGEINSFSNEFIIHAL